MSSTYYCAETANAMRSDSDKHQHCPGWAFVAYGALVLLYLSSSIATAPHNNASSKCACSDSAHNLSHISVHALAASQAIKKEASIAFFIQISNCTVDHLPRLISSIYHPHNVYAIHLDRKVPVATRNAIMKRIFEQKRAYSQNVFVMDSEAVTYRGMSMVLNTINAMNFLLEKDNRWQYMINLSGSDYPLVSAQTMRLLLGPYREEELNFVSFTHDATWEQKQRWRMQNMHVDPALSFGDDGQTVEQLRQENPLWRAMKLQYTTAEAWMIASRRLCDFAVRSGFARKLLLTFSMSVEAAEHYFATLVWNDRQLNASVVPHAMRHVVWRMNGKHAGQHPFEVDAVDERGRFQFEGLLRQSPNLFIRKFGRANSALMTVAEALWEDEEHVRRVRRHLQWAVRAGAARRDGGGGR